MLPSSFATKLALQATYVGIDFGTSTTVVSIASKENGIDSIKTLPIKLTQILEDGTIYKSEKLPSVIAWFNGKLLVGENIPLLEVKTFGFPLKWKLEKTLVLNTIIVRLAVWMVLGLEIQKTA